MTNVYKSNNAQTLTYLLRRINQGDNPELLRKEAHQLLTNVGPDDITTAEQNLINDGYSTHTVQLLSATFMLMGITEKQDDNPKSWLPANHLVRMVMTEHDLIQYFIADLNNLAEKIENTNRLTSVGLELRRLAHIVEQFKAELITTTHRFCEIMQEHLWQEDVILYPIALGIINNARIWEEMKAVCDEIGYCGVHPKAERSNV